MNIICGPANNQRELTINLPSSKELLGVFVSGGIDSAILYYLILRENIRLCNLHDIIPFTVLRKEGSWYSAVPVIEHIHESLNLPMKYPLNVGDSSLPDHRQVSSGMKDAYDAGCDKIYAGLIEQLPQHMIGWTPIPYKETDKFKVPFCHLNKSHIIDLVVKFKQECLFHITHSCVHDKVGRCGNCNGCNEKSWGFEQLGLTDPGKF